MLRLRGGWAAGGKTTTKCRVHCAGGSCYDVMNYMKSWRVLWLGTQLIVEVCYKFVTWILDVSVQTLCMSLARSSSWGEYSWNPIYHILTSLVRDVMNMWRQWIKCWGSNNVLLTLTWVGCVPRWLITQNVSLLLWSSEAAWLYRYNFSKHKANLLFI